MRHGMPVLGICRGLQIINVAMGGTLAQHLPDVTRSDVHRRAPGQFIDHPVRTAPGSRISEIVGPQLDAPSHHHQGVDVLASGLVATAWAEDGVVEAAEALGAGWVVAVQWHPEEGHSSALFRAFVAEAAANRDRGAVTTAAADAVAL
jgi:putative glutamine amidotransferase